jgi:hypothetical protein
MDISNYECAAHIAVLGLGSSEITNSPRLKKKFDRFKKKHSLCVIITQSKYYPYEQKRQSGYRL